MRSLLDKLITPEKANTAVFWDDLYGQNVSPWDTGRPDRFLQETIARATLRQRSEVLDVGCGTGTNALWLAQQGFRVTGVDISAIAIERAKVKASSVKHMCNFVVADVLTLQMPVNSFDFAFDLGCFHQFDVPSNRDAFACSICALLKPSAKLLSINGSTDGTEFNGGPPRRSAREIVEAFEPYFRFLSLRTAIFDREGKEQSQAWIGLMERRPDVAVK
jgi:ubiquinone/menaquinone biosynthesis C-methylase UbiE